MAEDNEEEDYMSMILPDDPSAKNETSLQRTARERREALERSRVKSKKERAADAIAARETALDTSLDRSNKGFKMMEKLGFKGGALGKKDGDAGITEPLYPFVRKRRVGIGVDAPEKSRVSQASERRSKKMQMRENDYRDHVRQEASSKYYDRQVKTAQKVAERLDDDIESLAGDVSDSVDSAEIKKHSSLAEKPLQSINVLWRGLVKDQREKERNRRIRHDLQASLSRLPTYADPDEEKDDKMAFGNMEEELEEEDPELEAFDQQTAEERLSMLVQYLRQQHHYCFWCKYKYPDENMEGCPGLSEEEHG